MKTKLSIIIASFNTKEVLRKCLESLKYHNSTWLQKKLYEVIVVDNGSTDGTIGMLKTEFPWTKLIINKNNLGFGVANNLGVKETSGKYILFLNPDTEVEKDTLIVMVEFMEKSSPVGIATCRVLLHDGTLDDASHRGFPTPWRAFCHFCGLGGLFPDSMLFNGYHLGYRDMHKAHEIDACAGAFLMIRREAGEKVGWFDADYFWYGEDLDLCYKVKHTGYKIMFAPQVSILHLKGAASGIKKHSQHLSRIDAQTKKKIMQARFEVMRTFYRKHYMDKYPRWLTTLVFWGISLKQRLTG